MDVEVVNLLEGLNESDVAGGAGVLKAPFFGVKLVHKDVRLTGRPAEWARRIAAKDQNPVVLWHNSLHG
jgi:hypothetical protein